MSEDRLGARARTRTGRLSRADALASVTELDRQLLMAVSAQRVLTQTQLERLFAETSSRTVRYRTERLARLGLLGRSRPYRARGSAPFHYWPTSVADAFARGESVPRRGERAEPNPLFLAHAAGLSELYVVLATQADTLGLRLRAFCREGDAREELVVTGRRRAIAPDARIELQEGDGRLLVGHVELDLGTMSHTRLKAKAAGYAAYAAEAAWQERYPFCPCLLFLTTTEARALTFLRALVGLVEKERWASRSYYSRGNSDLASFTAGVCAMARTPDRALAEPCWDDLGQTAGGLTLIELLNAARAPHDARLAQERAERERREREFAALRADPLRLRVYLKDKKGFDLTTRLERFGPHGHAALALLIESVGPLDRAEQEALQAFADCNGEGLLQVGSPSSEWPRPSREQQSVVDALADHYRQQQRALVADLERTRGPLPCLRSARATLSQGELLGRYELDSLGSSSEAQAATRLDQLIARDGYLVYRRKQARRNAGLTRSLLQDIEPWMLRIDELLVRRCQDCGETIYPEADAETGRFVTAERCPYCGGSGLDPAGVESSYH